MAGRQQAKRKTSHHAIKTQIPRLGEHAVHSPHWRPNAWCNVFRAHAQSSVTYHLEMSRESRFYWVEVIVQDVSKALVAGWARLPNILHRTSPLKPLQHGTLCNQIKSQDYNAQPCSQVSCSHMHHKTPGEQGYKCVCTIISHAQRTTSLCTLGRLILTYSSFWIPTQTITVLTYCYAPPPFLRRTSRKSRVGRNSKYHISTS